ncbi:MULTISPECIES: DUF554 domain-containing protein [Cyanophyceae]|uniref:DUF554 domain-containing protein n=1 Tax=Cyanophyceae TaxID=3028117 RepID=UPI0016876C6D|nr:MULTISPECIES: DUF554 domain-containing protein [Cyanophyceae]MBD1914866.1 DUF554 domain-containing protein [Phormidium sp. FACHB-77]MBD2028544.1 DUF554 domain-containing protein [Phormidium sp. FACHB-322]MBD2051812.1 DUF554 domain-containing protein [Leptolyngbya sp. FACHB-60]
MLSLWAKTSGTWINVATILLGTTLGLMLRSRLPKSMQQIITQAVGLMTLVIGVSMASNLSDVDAGPIDGIILALLVMAMGGMLGEWWQIEKRLSVLGDWLKAKVRGGGRFTEGFVAASLLFCVGPMAIVGSLNNGLSGDNALLTLKSTMDGLAAIALTGTYGVGVGFSALSVLGIQGALSLLSSLLGTVLADPTTSPHVLLLTGTGGLMILGIGLNLLEIGQVRVASFLPALLLCPVAIALAQRL